MKKKVIWITGASSGIGRSLAIKFANKGWLVAISARRNELLKEIEAKHEKITAFSLDVTDKYKCKEIFEKIKKKYGNIDICFFCAGIYEPRVEKEIDLDRIQEVMNTNFFGTLNCIKAVEEYLKQIQSGHIAIVSSIAGYRGLPNSSGYGPSKSALNNLAESLYFNFKKKNVRVSLISPGFIKTSMTNKNTFKMPFIRSPEYAADKIYNGLIKSNTFEITFPKELTTILKILRILPNSLYFYIIEKFIKN